METIRIGKIPYRVLSDEQASAKRQDFIANPKTVAGIDNLAKLMGQKAADEYFSKVLNNLKYEEFRAPAEPFCPRKSFHNNPKYVCTFNCPKVLDNSSA